MRTARAWFILHLAICFCNLIKNKTFGGSQNDVATIRLSENFVYDVLAHFSVHDAVALNN